MFLLGYLLYLGVGVGGFGMLSFLFYTIEVSEHRTLSPGLTTLGFALLNLGVTTSCILLGFAGIMGGYAATVNSFSVHQISSMLDPFIYPITIAVLVAVMGAIVTMAALMTAKASRS